MALNKKQEEKLAEILANVGTVIFTAVIAGQFFPDVYLGGISRPLVISGGLVVALACWIWSIYVVGD